MDKKEIELTPNIYADDFPSEVKKEMIENDIIFDANHSDSVYIDWIDMNDMPHTQEWLFNTYGTEIKGYNSFCVIPT